MAKTEFKFDPIGNVGDNILIQKMTNEENDKVYLRISKTYTDKTTGETKPSSQGISIPAELVDDLKNVLSKWEG